LKPPVAVALDLSLPVVVARGVSSNCCCSGPCVPICVCIRPRQMKTLQRWLSDCTRQLCRRWPAELPKRMRRTMDDLHCRCPCDSQAFLVADSAKGRLTFKNDSRKIKFQKKYTNYPKCAERLNSWGDLLLFTMRSPVSPACRCSDVSVQGRVVLTDGKGRTKVSRELAGKPWWMENRRSSVC